MSNVIITVALIMVVAVVGYTIGQIEEMVDSKDILEAGDKAVEEALDELWGSLHIMPITIIQWRAF